MKILVKIMVVLIFISLILSCENKKKQITEESEYLVINSLYSGNNFMPRIKVRTLDIKKGIIISQTIHDFPEIYNNNINFIEKLNPSESLVIKTLNTIREDNIIINYYVHGHGAINNDYEINDILLIIFINDYIGKFILSITEIKYSDNTFLFYENNYLKNGDGNNILNENGNIENIDLYENIIYSFINEQDVSKNETSNIIKLIAKIIKEIFE